MQERLDATHPAHVEHGCFDGGSVRGGIDLTVQKDDVVVHHHMDVRDVEAARQVAQLGPHPIGQHGVVHCGIGPTAFDSIFEASQLPGGIPKLARALLPGRHRD